MNPMENLRELNILWKIIRQFKHHVKYINVKYFDTELGHGFLFDAKNTIRSKYMKYHIYKIYNKSHAKFDETDETFEYDYIRDILLKLLQCDFKRLIKSYLHLYLRYCLWISEPAILNSQCMGYLNCDSKILLGNKYLYSHILSGICVSTHEMYICIHEYMLSCYLKRHIPYLGLHSSILRDYHKFYTKWDKLDDFYETYPALCLGDLRALSHRNYTAIRQNITTLFLCARQFGVYRNLRNYIAEYVCDIKID
jgi:hypothetical protein